MTTNVALEVVDEPPHGIAPADAATIIRTIGALLIDAYAETAPGTVGDQKSTRNAWGSKQREQLLRALIDRVAANARALENAALSATDTAIATFARDEFKNGHTRSRRDRAPITKNIDKVVGGWLRRLGRKMRENVVVASMQREVALRERTASFRLTLTFAYPWRIVADRRLLITARIDECLPGGAKREVPFPANPHVLAVRLREPARRYRPEHALHVRDLFQSMKSFADSIDDDDLKNYADAGLRMFVPRSVAKIAFVVILTLAVSTAASPQGRRFVKRVVDAITSSSSLPELLRKLTVDTEDAMFVTPSGVQAPTVRSGSGSQVRLSPGPSPQLLHVEATLSGKDFAELTSYMVMLGEIGRVGVNAVQYRSAPHEPIVPWIVEVVVVPEQDPELAAELARQTASISIAYDPPLEQPQQTRSQIISVATKRVNLASELRELPHKPQRYAVTATVVRESGAPQVHRAHLRVDEHGFAALEREVGKALTPVAQDVKVGHPICTTILHTQTLPMFIPGQTDYLWALANAASEQDVRLIVYPPSSNTSVLEATVDWGDGSKGTQERDREIFFPTHTYRVGERAYPIRIFFKGSDVVYSFDLFVFGTRQNAESAVVLDYVTPYPPNPEITDLAQDGSDGDDMSVLIRKGPVTTESITYSRHVDDWVWQVPLDYKTDQRLKIRYFWREGNLIVLRE